MQDKNFVSLRKAQTGETITWIVATVIIIAVLGFSIFIANAVFKAKEDGGVSISKSGDVLASKSLYAYVLTKDANEKTVYEQIKSESKLNDFNGNLAKSIFISFYQEDYSTQIWLGTNNEDSSYFGKLTLGQSGSREEHDPIGGIYEKIQLKKHSSTQVGDDLTLYLCGGSTKC